MEMKGWMGLSDRLFDMGSCCLSACISSGVNDLVGISHEDLG